MSMVMNSLFRNALVTLMVVLATFVSTQVAAQVVLPSNVTSTKSADALIDLIRSVQKQNVRESWGEKASECFTDLDLVKFHDADIPKRVVQELRTDMNFIAIVQSLKSLNTQQRQELLDRAASTYKPTWAQIGKIDRRGQTDAGQQAEKEIAAAITALVKEML